jgi:tRNA (adenine22-N1)-methyltransferase
MVIKLDNRLISILSEIEGDVLADIGCDHGKLSISALLNDKCKRVIAVDISEKSLQKTIELARDCSCSNSIETRVSDGFKAITQPIDTAVIAGLGGYEIKSILLDKLPPVRRFIVCPHQNASVARKALNQIGYGALKDYIVQEGEKYYPIIVAEKNQKIYCDDELRFGKNLPKKADYYNMLRTRKQVLDLRFPDGILPAGEMTEEYQR